jgi:hypothetical protein
MLKRWGKELRSRPGDIHNPLYPPYLKGERKTEALYLRYHILPFRIPGPR